VVRCFKIISSIISVVVESSTSKTFFGIRLPLTVYILANSELHQGTTFNVYLPQVDLPVEVVSSPAARIEGPSREGEMVLVVEDERSFRDLLYVGLQSRGYRVLVASNGVDALQVAERHNGPIHLLITDVIMLQMSGPELARSLIDVRGDIDVLYMSGYADDKLGNITAPNGDLTSIQKPFYLDDLWQKIKEILPRKNTPSSQAPGSTSATRPKSGTGRIENRKWRRQRSA
jgi:two-component system, cell cycle sensor histidine kinase and response regulator CckA